MTLFIPVQTLDRGTFRQYRPDTSAYSRRFTDQEWQAHRATIEGLHSLRYTREQILEVLNRKHGFTPTLPQLAARLERWGLRYRKPPRGAARPRAKLAGQALNSGKASLPVKRVYQDVLANELISPMTKTRRTRQEVPGYSVLHVGSELLTHSPTCTPDTLEEYRSPTATAFVRSLHRRSSQHEYTAHVSRLVEIPIPGDAHDTDHILHNIQALFDHSLSLLQENVLKSPTDPTLGSSSWYYKVKAEEADISAVHFQAAARAFNDALGFLLAEIPVKAIERLQEASKHIDLAIQRPSADLLIRLLHIATWCPWMQFPHFRTPMLKLFHGLTRERFGPNHPLTSILLVLSQSNSPTSTHWFPTIWEFLLKKTRQAETSKLPQTSPTLFPDESVVVEAHFSLISTLHNLQDFDGALARGLQLNQRLDHTDLFWHYKQQARLRLAHAHKAKGDFENAAIIYEDVRQRQRNHADMPPPSPSPSSSSSPSPPSMPTTTTAPPAQSDINFDLYYQGWVAFDLARLHDRENHTTKAQELYKAAFEMYHLFEGPTSSGTLLILKKYVEFLRRHGQRTELKRVRVRYPTAWFAVVGTSTGGLMGGGDRNCGRGGGGEEKGDGEARREKALDRAFAIEQDTCRPMSTLKRVARNVLRPLDTNAEIAGHRHV